MASDMICPSCMKEWPKEQMTRLNRYRLACPKCASRALPRKEKSRSTGTKTAKHIGSLLKLGLIE